MDKKRTVKFSQGSYEMETFLRLFWPTPAAWEHAQVALRVERVLERDGPEKPGPRLQGGECRVEFFEEGSLVIIERPRAVGWHVAMAILDANEKFQKSNPEETQAAKDWRATNIPFDV